MSIEKKPSAMLIDLIDAANRSFEQIVKGIETVKGIVTKVYNQAIADGFTPKEARKFMYSNLQIFSDRTIRKYLPEESKQIQVHAWEKRRKTVPPLSHDSEQFVEKIAETNKDLAHDLEEEFRDEAAELKDDIMASDSESLQVALAVKDNLEHQLVRAEAEIVSLRSEIKDLKKNSNDGLQFAHYTCHEKIEGRDGQEDWLQLIQDLIN